MIAASVPFVLNVDWIWATAAVFAIYGLALYRVRGTAWPRARVAFFSLGMLAVLLAFVTPLDNYDSVSFFAHTAQHLMLVFVIAPLVALGAPITLVVRASPPWLRDRVLRPILESRVMAVLTHPVVDWVLFVGFLVVTHLPPVYDATLRIGNFHLVVHLLYLLLGFLFWWPIVGLDPVPQRASFPARLAYLLLAVPVAAAIGLVVFLERDPLYRFYAKLPSPWGGEGAVNSQHHGALLFFAGAAALLVAASFVNRAWRRGRTTVSEVRGAETSASGREGR